MQGRARVGLFSWWRRFPFLGWLLFAVQVLFSWQAVGEPFFLGRFLLTLVSLQSLAVVVNGLVPDRRVLRSALPVLFFLIYVLLAFYHQQATMPLDLDLLLDHGRELMAPPSWAVLVDRLAPWQWRVIAVLYVGSVVVEGRWQRFAADVRRPRGWSWALLGGLIYGALVVSPLASYDEVSLVLRSARRPRPLRTAPNPESALYPYVKWHAGVTQETVTERPNIFLLMIESFNSGFVEQLSPTGRTYTPFFNSLIARGIYAEHFYGNSVYTVQGQSATLCSVIPPLHGSLARDYAGLGLQALPRLLRDNGYDTYFAQAAPELAFHNTGPFMQRLGFEALWAMAPETLTQEERAHLWGWGLQDDWFYRNVFARLDKSRGRRAAPRPVFLTLATISSHSPFDTLPADQRALYARPLDKRQHYANTLHAVDGYLREFFAQLAARPYLSNSIVIILGDHGHPMGEHGNFMTEVGWREENFRVPFLLLWEGRLTARRLTDCAYSQVDVAPTLLDLLDLSAWHHFTGCSLLAPPAPEQEAILVQPYGGQFIGVVRYPYKYVLHVARNEEFLFHLTADPKEERDLRFHRGPGMSSLRAAATRAFFNQRLIDENRIWPATSSQKSEARRTSGGQ